MIDSASNNIPRKRGHVRESETYSSVFKLPNTTVSRHISKNHPFRTIQKKILFIITLVGIIFFFVIIISQRGPLRHTPNHSEVSLRQVLEKTCLCDVNVCDPNTNGIFVGSFENHDNNQQRNCLSSDDIVRIVMDRIKSKISFAWVRWGDGEISESTADREYSKKLKASLHYLSRHDDSIVNVGMWWLKNQRFARQWNSVVPPQLSNSVKNASRLRPKNTVGEQRQDDMGMKKMIFHNHFYLPMGGPLNTYTKEIGIAGWLYEIEDYNIILVGPSHLGGIPFLNPFKHFESSGVNRNMVKTADLASKCKELMDQQMSDGGGKPLMFLLAAGFSSKIIIADLLQYRDESNNHYTQSFIDIGASLDGYVGIHSRDYNSPKHYCEEVVKNDDPRNRYHWMKRGICEEKYWKDYNDELSKVEKMDGS